MDYIIPKKTNEATVKKRIPLNKLKTFILNSTNEKKDTPNRIRKISA